MRMRSKPASRSCGRASSHSRPSLLPPSESSNAFSMSALPASSAAGVEPERVGQLAHGDLVQVAVVDPDALAVADDHLVVGLRVRPAEFARPLEHEAALRPCTSLPALSYTFCSKSARAACVLVSEAP